MKILSKILNFLNFWSWPIEVFGDIHEWMLLRKALNETDVQEVLSKCPLELRIDDISRIYTIVNIPPEVDVNHQMEFSYVITQLRIVDEFLLKVGISELVYPEIERVSDENSRAYLIILSPPIENIKPKELIYQAIRYFVIFIIYRFVFIKLNLLLLNLFNFDIISFFSNILPF